MLSGIKRKLENVYYQIINDKLLSDELFIWWKRNNSPIPLPTEMKQTLLGNLQKQTRLNTLVETGTYLGQMVEAQLNNFHKIYSIELSKDLHEKAKTKFQKCSHVELLEGNSGEMLASVVAKLEQPAMFWLDGHYSGDITARGELICPIYQELECIFRGKKLRHLLLIDDERLFNGTDDYPTKEDLFSFIKSKDDSCSITVKYDVIMVQLGYTNNKN